ncbi:MAG: Periplasmic binding protein [Nitrosarchaeum sp.]|nr:Periplasmic binding protein [Nitrosarchaeum sp.]
MFKEQSQTITMPIKRIVSFLPSATELLYELGAQDMLYGVTHECKYPEDAKTKPCVINSVINSEELSSKEIDDKTCQLIKEGRDVFVLNTRNLLEANPDLIISQETCEVCAANTNQVNKAVQILQKKPVVYTMNPHNLQEILESVSKVGKILKKENEASIIIEKLKNRIKNVKKQVIATNLKVLAIEWIEPFFTAGHWVPEIIENAGGRNLISKPGEYSRRLDIQEIIDSDPDMIILMPCGFDIERTLLEYNKILKDDKVWCMLRAVRNKNIFAVDANSYFSKPSIKTITGLEIIAKIINPGKFWSLNVPENSFLQIK